MSRRKPYSLQSPRKGKRRYWTAVFRESGSKRRQLSTGRGTQLAAREWAVAWIRQHSPKLSRMLDLKPLKLPRLTESAPPINTQENLSFNHD